MINCLSPPHNQLKNPDEKALEYLKDKHDEGTKKESIVLEGTVKANLAQCYIFQKEYGMAIQMCK
jgi:hypothetical protein